MNSVISAHFILQVTYNPQGSLILTASSDKTARLWDPTSGNCIQVNLDMATLLLLSYCQTHTHTHSVLRVTLMRFSAAPSTILVTLLLQVYTCTQLYSHFDTLLLNLSYFLSQVAKTILAGYGDSLSRCWWQRSLTIIEQTLWLNKGMHMHIMTMWLSLSIL